MPLTVAEINSTKIESKRYKLYDGNGLYLLVRPTGTKSWYFKFKVAGKEQAFKVGNYPDMALSSARKEAHSIRLKIQNGEHLSSIKKTKSVDLDTPDQFKRIAIEWVNNYGTRWSESHKARVLKSLELDVFPLLGNMPLPKITSNDILKCVRSIESRGALEKASRVLQRINSVFKYGVICNYCQSIPGIALVGAVRKSPVKHRARLSIQEFPELWNKINEMSSDPITKLALQFLGHTFVRTSELRFSVWSEIDFEHSVWRIPADRMKMNREHIVPLTKQTLSILNQIKDLGIKSEYIFASKVNHTKPISENTMLYALYRLGYHSRMTGHGFRGVASTALNENGFNSLYIERQLAHLDGDDVRAAYNFAQYIPQRTEMMHWWSNYLDTMIVAPQNKKGSN